MRIAAVDYGDVRTGFACSDSNETLAFPAGVAVEKDMSKVITIIIEKIREINAELLVIGLPRNMDGTEGKQAQKCAELAERLRQQISIPVVTWDERVTTKIAVSIMNENDTRGRKRRNRIDEVAATVILQSYLDYRKFNTVNEYS